MARAVAATPPCETRHRQSLAPVASLPLPWSHLPRLLHRLCVLQVSNKVVEMLMMRSGIDVCCTSDEDVQRMQRLGGSDSGTQ